MRVWSIYAIYFTVISFKLLYLCFFFCDQETNLDYYKIDGNKNLAAVFMKLLKSYIKCLNERSLPNYFIRWIIFWFSDDVSTRRMLLKSTIKNYKMHVAPTVTLLTTRFLLDSVRPCMLYKNWTSMRTDLCVCVPYLLLQDPDTPVIFVKFPYQIVCKLYFRIW